MATLVGVGRFRATSECRSAPTLVTAFLMCVVLAVPAIRVDAASTTTRSLISLIGKDPREAAKDEREVLVAWGIVQRQTRASGHVVSDLELKNGGVPLRGQTPTKITTIHIKETIDAIKAAPALSEREETVVFLKEVPNAFTGTYEIVGGESGHFVVSTASCTDAPAKTCKKILNDVFNAGLWRGDTFWHLFLHESNLPNVVDSVRDSFTDMVNAHFKAADERARILEGVEKSPNGPVPLEVLQAFIMFVDTTRPPRTVQPAR